MPTIIVMLIIRIGYLMDAGFEQVYARESMPDLVRGLFKN